MEKGNENNHNFDLSKPQKRSFDLTKDSGGSEKWYNRYGKRWLWIGGGTLAVGLALLWVLNKGSDTSDNNTDEPTPIISETPAELLSPDSLNNETEMTIIEGVVEKSEAQEEEVIDIHDDNIPSDSSNDNAQDLEEAALSVIRGNYGNNPIRRQKLGDRYQEIQDCVNQMYREGKVR